MEKTRIYGLSPQDLFLAGQVTLPVEQTQFMSDVVSVKRMHLHVVGMLGQLYAADLYLEGQSPRIPEFASGFNSLGVRTHMDRIRCKLDKLPPGCKVSSVNLEEVVHQNKSAIHVQITTDNPQTTLECLGNYFKIY